MAGHLYPDFDPDVFVSHSHGDPTGGGNSLWNEWTVTLIRGLERQIREVRTGFASVQIWMDDRIDPTMHLTPQLKMKVTNCGILVIIMTDWFLDSRWCRDEVEWFTQQVRARDADAGRVFIIRAQETAAKWPEFLQDERGNRLIGFKFHDSGLDYPYGWTDSRNPDFMRQLMDLYTALKKRLSDLKEQAELRARAAEAARPRLAAGRSKSVYLHAAPDGEGVRAAIANALVSEGIEARMAERAAAGGNALDFFRESALRIEKAKDCDALALLRVDESERFFHELKEIGVDERERMSNKRGVQMPCAVLDKTGKALPDAIAQLGITGFDINAAGWRGEFRRWLDADRGPPEGAPA